MNFGAVISTRKENADVDLKAPPFDDLRNYAYEGGDSTTESLSSLASDTDDEQSFDHLGGWVPRFDKLVGIYSQEGEERDQDKQEEVVGDSLSGTPDKSLK
uniref:Cadherin Y-type LIR-motif domain-containing protein n=1 Tax=Timema poppense TaxID=170557 RepID=A0A7R9DRS6_TIMPO|nr:unnamed protein product [Timema poppensis]